MPALKLHDRNQPVTLTCGIPHHVILGWACASATLQCLTRWSICCQDEKNGENKDVVDEEEETETVRGSIPSLQPSQSLDGCYFSPLLVADWFWSVVGMAVEELRRNPQRGIPVPDRVERNGPLTTLILTAGTSRILTTCFQWCRFVAGRPSHRAGSRPTISGMAK